MRLRFHLLVANAAVRFGRYEAAAAAYARFLGLEPDRPDIKFHRAWCLVQVPHRRDEGIAAFEQLLKTSASASGFYLMGIALHQQGRHDEAVAAFHEAARRERFDVADFHMNLGASLTALGRWTEAGEAFGNAAHLAPQDAEAWDGLGTALMESGRWHDALPCHERARRLAPAEDCTNLIVTMMELGRLDEAERLLREVLALKPTAAVMKEMLADVLLQRDRPRDALELARDVRSVNPDSASARATLATVLAEVGHVDEALAEAEAAEALAPELPIVHCALGFVRLNLKDAAAALAAFDRMAECLEQAADRSIVTRNKYLTGRGLALSLLGDHCAAKAAFDEIIRSDPTYFERHHDVAPQYQLSLHEAEQHEQS